MRDGMCKSRRTDYVRFKIKALGEPEKTDAGLHRYNGLKTRLTSENPRLKISLTLVTF